MIHPSAVISAEAKIGADVEIGPFAVVEGDVEIGDGSKLQSHVVALDGTRIGKGVTIGNGSVIAGLPQDLSFNAATRTYARIGDGATLREGVTINRATQEGKSTSIGEKCFLMAATHVGHDCVVGSRVVMANGSLLAGFVTVGDHVFIGGLAGIHQFCRIGEGVMFGGQGAATMDVAPFTKFSDRNTLYGLNLVGLRRRGFSREAIKAIQACYRSVFTGTGSPRGTALSLLERGLGETEEARAFLEFFLTGKRGFARPSKGRG